MTMVAKEAGLKRRSLYEALREGGDPTLGTFTGALKALGLRLAVAPLAAAIGRRGESRLRRA